MLQWCHPSAQLLFCPPARLLFSHPVMSSSLQPVDSSTPGLLSLTVSWSLHKFMSIASMMPSSHLILWHPLLLSVFPSTGDFSSESAVHIRWPKHWSFSFSPSSEYSEFISPETDWFYLLAVQGTLRSLLQDHSLKASILWLSASLMVQLSQLYVTTRKTIALTIWTFDSRAKSLLFSILSRFVLASPTCYYLQNKSQLLYKGTHSLPGWGHPSFQPCLPLHACLCGLGLSPPGTSWHCPETQVLWHLKCFPFLYTLSLFIFSPAWTVCYPHSSPFHVCA